MLDEHINSELPITILLSAPYQIGGKTWTSAFTMLSNTIPMKGIYESEMTHERYIGELTFKFGSMVIDWREIELVSISGGTDLSDGETLRLTEVLIPAKPNKPVSNAELLSHLDELQKAREYLRSQLQEIENEKDIA